MLAKSVPWVTPASDLFERSLDPGMWSNLALVLQCLVAWLGASVGASYLPLASWDLYLDTLHTVLFKHLEGAWAWSPASALPDIAEEPDAARVVNSPSEQLSRIRQELAQRDS